MTEGPPAAIAAWVEREALPFPILLDPDRTLATAYGVATPDTASYVAHNAEGRRPAVLIDAAGRILAVLPDLQSVAEQQAVLAGLP